ncbi:two pore domain potassium channel family protein [Chelatococcus daeguensis]|nr:two pore domain potassium channel family protein [Chelatococcus daeguensis]
MAQGGARKRGAGRPQEVARRRPLAETVSPSRAKWRRRLAILYFGDSRPSFWFRLGLIGFDAVTILYFLIATVIYPEGDRHWIDYLVAAVLTVDYAARMAIAPTPWRFPLRGASLVDAIVIFSLVVPVLANNFAFLRLLRISRFLQSPYMSREITAIFPAYRENEEAVRAGVNLAVFILMITSVVFVWEYGRNPGINNYLDALYFTVTTLTTTGFGDIIMTDTVGRMLTVVTMVVGVAMFVNLARALFRPTKVYHACPSCGLERHDADAVHCKHCGRVLNIASEGFSD